MDDVSQAAQRSFSASGNVRTQATPQPQADAFGFVPSQDGEGGPTIPANRPRRIPEQFIPKADADAAVQLAWWRGAFAGAIGMALLGAFAAVLT